LLQVHPSEQAAASQHNHPYVQPETDIWQGRAWEPETEHVSLRGAQEDLPQDERYSDYSTLPQEYEQPPFAQDDYEIIRLTIIKIRVLTIKILQRIGYPDQFEDQYSSDQFDWDTRSTASTLSSRSAHMRETFLSLLGGRLRAWHAVVLIGFIAVISIGWGFMHRSRIGSHEIAIIQAPEGPMKVKPSIEADQDAPQTGGATVLIVRKQPL